jgi:hypothetical protein
MSNVTRRGFLGGSAATMLAGGVTPFLPPASTQPASAEPNLAAQVQAAVRPGQNIIFFMPDELRADVLGCYGNPIAKTPNYDRLAGTKAAHEHFARSLVPQIHGAPGDPERAILTEGGYNTYEPQCFEADPPPTVWYHDRINLEVPEPVLFSRTAALRTVNYTLVSRPQGVNELYLRKEDPEERQNRYNDPALADIRHRMELRLMHWYVNTTGVAPMDRDPRGFPAPGKPPAPRHPIATVKFPKSNEAAILDAG